MKNILNKIIFRFFYIYLIFFRYYTNIKIKFSNNSLKLQFLGSEYGGFYVNLIDPDSIKVVLSFGIGNDISFDKEIHKITGCKIFMFDPTDSISNFLDSQNLNTSFSFYPIGISVSDIKTKFFKPLNDDHISHSLVKHENVSDDYYYSDFKTWNTICADLSINKVDVLKMDIEGSEFEVIYDIFNSTILPEQICIEFHPRFIKNGINEFFKVLNQFKIRNYILVAVNYSGNEFLFIKNF